MAKRSGFYFVVWAAIYFLTHFLTKYLGSGGTTIGLTMMMFTIGILLFQYGILSIKAIKHYGLIKRNSTEVRQ
jgi:hypothetical protein